MFFWEELIPMDKNLLQGVLRDFRREIQNWTEVTDRVKAQCSLWPSGSIPCWGARLSCKKPVNSLDSIWQWEYVTHSQREQAGCVWLLWNSCHPSTTVTALLVEGSCYGGWEQSLPLRAAYWSITSELPCCEDWAENTDGLLVGESNPGLPRDRRRYLPLY